MLVAISSQGVASGLACLEEDLEEDLAEAMVWCDGEAPELPACP